MEEPSFWGAVDQAVNSPPAAPQQAPPQQSSPFWDTVTQAMGTNSQKSQERMQELAPRVEQSNQWAAQKNQNAPVQVMGVPGWDINLGKEVGSETLGGVGVSVKDILRKSIPGTEFQGKEETKRYGEAKRAYEDYLSGKTDDKPSDAQLGRIAEYEYDQQREAARSQRSKIASAALGVPKVLGEFAAAGPVIGGVGGALGGGVGATAAATAAATPLMPEFWLQESQERANKNGGNWYDPKNVSVPLAKAAVQNVVLGQISKLAGAAAGRTATSPIGQLGVRAAVGAAAMPLESTAAETLTSTVQAALSETKFSKYLDSEDEQFKTFRDVLVGKWGDVGTKLATDALMGAGFSAFHGKESDQVESLTKAGEALKKTGLSNEGVAKALQDAVSKPPDDLPKGSVRDYVESVQDAVRQDAIKRQTPAAEPPADQTPAGQEIAPPAEAQKPQSLTQIIGNSSLTRIARPEPERKASAALSQIKDLADEHFGESKVVPSVDSTKPDSVEVQVGPNNVGFRPDGENRVAIDFGRDNQWEIGGGLQSGTKAFVDRMKPMLGKLKDAGKEISYTASKSEKDPDGSRRGKVYSRLLKQAGFEQKQKQTDTQPAVWAPKEKIQLDQSEHPTQEKVDDEFHKRVQAGDDPAELAAAIQRGQTDGQSESQGGNAADVARSQAEKDQNSRSVNPQGDQAGAAEAERGSLQGPQVGKKESSVDADAPEWMKHNIGVMADDVEKRGLGPKILELHNQGKTAKEIARVVGIPVEDVRAYRTSRGLLAHDLAEERPAVPQSQAGKEEPALMTREEAMQVRHLTTDDLRRQKGKWERIPGEHLTLEEAATAVGPSGAIHFADTGRRVDVETGFGYTQRVVDPRWVAYKKAGAEEPAANSEEGIPLHEMTPAELAETYRDKKARDERADIEVLGEEGAKRWKRLDRMRNSTNDETAAKAEKEIGEIESKLSEKEVRKLYGMDETGPQLDEIKDYQRSLDSLDYDSPELLGKSLRYKITKLPRDETDPEKMNHEEKVAWATIRHAVEFAKDKGWDVGLVQREALAHAATRFSDPEDAFYMLKRFLPKNRAPVRRQPSIGMPEQKALSPAVPQSQAGKEEPAVNEFRLPWQQSPTPAQPNKAGNAVSTPVKGWVDELRSFLAPATRNETAKVGGGIIRANRAAEVRNNEVGQAALKAGQDYFDNLVAKARGDVQKLKDQFLAFTDPIQSGQIAAMGPEMKTMAETVRRLNDEMEAELVKRDLLDVNNLVENYLGQMWTDPTNPNASPADVGQRLGQGRRPLAGSEGFKKQRTLPTYREGFDAGLLPKDWNPIRTVLAKRAEVSKAIMAHDTLQELRENGQWEFVRLGGKNEPNWERINDKAASVFAPPEAKIKEWFDKQQMEGLENFAQKHGIDVKTLVSNADWARAGMTGGLPKPVGSNVAGASFGNTVLRRFGTPEEVLAHEIGHQIDAKYDLQQGLAGPVTQKEMIALADLRASGRVDPQYQAYLRSPAEQAANLVAAYLHAPELLHKIAPESAKWFDQLIASNKDLQPLRDIKPSLELDSRDQMMRLAGPLLTGHYYTPGETAKLINNHLSPGFYGESKIYEGVRNTANLLNGFQLGFSAFHAGFVAMDTQVSALALGLKQISRGEFRQGVKNTLLGFVPGAAPVKSYLAGTKVGKEYFAPGSMGADVAAITDSLVQAGGRARMDAFYGGTHIDSFRKALRDVRAGELKRTPSLLGNALPALQEMLSKPIMEKLVPRMKLGVYADLARSEMEKNPNMTREQMRDALGKSWDSVENRLGQMTYDNLFWNRHFKDVLMAGVRSVGWNVGTVRELGGGIKDIPRSAFGTATGKGITDRTAYLVALPMVAAMYGGIYQYLATGNGPDDLRDAFNPKTGTTRKDGSADRVSLPSYMRDIMALTNRSGEGPFRIASNAWGMAKHKLNPLLGLTSEMLNNEDFYGKAIYLSTDSTVRQAQELATHLLSAFEPMAMKNVRQQTGKGATPAEAAQSLVGITPAPAYVTRSDAQQQAIEAKNRIQTSPQEKLKQERKKAGK